MQQFHVSQWKCLLNRSWKPFAGIYSIVRVLYSSKTIEEKPTTTFVTDLLEQPLKCAPNMLIELNVSHAYDTVTSESSSLDKSF